jgi:hypothetical protein
LVFRIKFFLFSIEKEGLLKGVEFSEPTYYQVCNSESRWRPVCPSRLLHTREHSGQGSPHHTGGLNSLSSIWFFGFSLDIGTLCSLLFDGFFILLVLLFHFPLTVNLLFNRQHIDFLY